MMVDNMKLLALLAALPLQYQTLWLVSSPDGHTRTSGRCLQAWRSTASTRVIFSFGHDVNVSASTRPRHEGRRRCAGLLAQSPSLSQPRRRAMVRGVQASFGRVVPSLPVFVSIIHQSLHMEVCGVRLNFLSIPSPPAPCCRAQHSRRGTGRLHQRRGLLYSNTEHVINVYSSSFCRRSADHSRPGTGCRTVRPCSLEIPGLSRRSRRGHSQCFATATSKTITANITWFLLSSPC